MKSRDYLLRAMDKKKMKAAEFSRFIGITEASMSRLIKDTRSMDDYTCIQVSDILDLDPMMLISLSNSEREKIEEKKEFWQERVKEYGYSTTKFLLILSLMFVCLFLYLGIASRWFRNWINTNYVKNITDILSDIHYEIIYKVLINIDLLGFNSEILYIMLNSTYYQIFSF